MQHSELVSALAKPGQDIIADMQPDKAHILHMAIGISGEVGELVEAIMLNDTVTQLEELGDLEFYFEGMCQGMGFENVELSQTDLVGFDVKSMLIDLSITASEILDTAKRMAIYNDDSQSMKMAENMDRYRIVISRVYHKLGIAREEARAKNIEKLSKRYASMSYSNAQAKSRADKG